MYANAEARARTRRTWGGWLRRCAGAGAPDAALAAFPLAAAVTAGAAVALPGVGSVYAELLRSGACDERTLVMLMLVRPPLVSM